MVEGHDEVLEAKLTEAKLLGLKKTMQFIMTSP